MRHTESLPRISNARLVVTVDVHGSVDEATSLDSGQLRDFVLELPQSLGFGEEAVGQSVRVPEIWTVWYYSGTSLGSVSKR